MSWVGHDIHSFVLPKTPGIPPLTLFGASRAAHGTGFAIPELGIQLDAGVIVHTAKPEHVLVTHSHTDHAYMLPHLRSRRRPPSIFVPTAVANVVERYLRASQELTNGEVLADDQYQVSQVINSVKVGDRFIIPRGKENFVVDVLPCNHSIATVGYGLSLKKTRLREEYAKLEGRALGELRKQGATLTEDFEAPVLCFMGDTSADVFFGEEKTFSKYPIIITECTFLEEAEAANAQKKCHTVWEGNTGLEKFVKQHPNILFILTHFSMKYSVSDITQFFQARALPNVLVWASNSSLPLTLGLASKIIRCPYCGCDCKPTASTAKV